MKTLVIPPAAQRDENSIQVISAWIADKGFHCTLNIGHFDANGHNEAEAWGILVADFIRHVGNAWAEERGIPAFETIDAVTTSMLKELGQPTSAVTGEFHVGHS